MLCEIHKPPAREIELGGDSHMSILAYLARLRVEQCGANVRPAITIAIPHWRRASAVTSAICCM